ncbi:hypothetical protein BS50DRAFT_673127 [Corynespora cassiicola Philippines]|uniref:DUF6590 domain-containing protein n=1 Tax=Corynespora cassiicola Philippines TaxID=1448308 RepID=A0A2T2P3Y6_CORCC|nr:hypothetical protein BS50DRAFT_673127 [Corynespora cassiicola Philippines]
MDSWTLDSARNQYYYFNHAENAYIYADGTRISTSGANNSSEAQPTAEPQALASTAPASSHPQNTSSVDVSSLSNDFSGFSIRDEIAYSNPAGSDSNYLGSPWSQNPTTPTSVSSRTAHGSQHRSTDTAQFGHEGRPPSNAQGPHDSPQAYQQQGHEGRQPNNAHYSTDSLQTYQQSSHGGYQSHGLQFQQSGDQRPSDQEILQEVDRDVELNPNTPVPDMHPHTTPHRHFTGTPGQIEKLDPDFQVQRSRRDFFRVGRVFRVLWPELAGDVAQNITLATTPLFPNEKIFCKIRWFVVVKPDRESCTCLPIQTYHKRGVSNKTRHHHAIMYTGHYPPQPLPTEEPQRHNELPMGDPIRVIPDPSKPHYKKMDPMSRVNFTKLYTVEYNVKVSGFGQVDLNDEHKLISQFNLQWNILPSQAYRTSNSYSYPTPAPVSVSAYSPYVPQAATNYHPAGNYPAPSYIHNTQPGYPSASPMYPIAENPYPSYQPQGNFPGGFDPQAGMSGLPTSPYMNPNDPNARPRHSRNPSSQGYERGHEGRRRHN